MLDVVTLGEMMVQFNPLSTGPLRHVVYFEKHAAGSEANFAIGMVRLGFKAGFITRIGNDEFGKYILSILRGEGVDTSRVKIDYEAPTGVYFIQRGYPIPGRSMVFYYRRGSAASKLSPDDIEEDYIRNSRLLHLTGITPALSESCREAALKSLNIAAENNIMVSLDTNIRLKLWSKEKARETMLPIIEKADIILTEPEDAEILVTEKEPYRIIEKMLSMGPKIVAVKLGEEGAIASNGKETIMKPGFKVPVVDVIGAGDAFAAGFIASILEKRSLGEALDFGNAAGALVVTTRGDIENLPTKDDVEKFLAFQRKEKIALR
ncbi:MAG: sugar kinase [Candidatus Bathyarchaeia archaeon]|nr:sugar kinase [Candidatus Bathyarchaeota archaeon]